ncbi:MAG: fluoride efflux transporter CrcB [Acidobacteriota bacterium]
MSRLLYVCLGGAIGSGARYLVGLWALQRFGPGFPYGTLIVNIVGCFVIAAVMQAALQLEWSPTLRMAITVGFVGGLTTYSSFNYETLRLVEEGASTIALLNVAATLVGGAIAGWLGFVVSRAVIGT